jgi:membrane peptidoglycan carboxypeptidase
LSCYYCFAMKRKLIKFFIVVLFVCFVIGLYFWTYPDVKNVHTARIYDRDGVLLYEASDFGGSQRPLYFDDIPQDIINSVVSVEDASFWSNPGVDVRAVFRALQQNIRSGHIVSGASTITQQLVRNVVFERTTSTKSYIQKTREILTAVRYDLFHSKESILEDYLNTVYMGFDNYGIGAAADFYFGKNVDNLSLAEASLLVGLISSPETNNPKVCIECAKKRQELVLFQMVKKGYLPKDIAEEISKESLHFVYKRPEIKAPHFVFAVLEELRELSLDKQAALNVYTTLDYDEYILARDVASRQIDSLKDIHNMSNASLVLLKNDTGAVRVMLGGIDYFDNSRDGKVNMATSLRQPGSAMKPLTYTLAFLNGDTPATKINDTQKVYITKDGQGYTPRNYDNKFHGEVSMRVALASSLNMPAVELLSRAGVDSFLALAHDMGISSLKRVDDYDLALTLGGGEVSLLELSNVYATYARGGYYLPTYTIEKVIDDDHNYLYSQENIDSKAVLGERSLEIAYLITHILKDPQARMLGFGEKNPLVLSHPAAVKTGTTTDWHDVWTLGYTPDYTVGVWVGNNNNAPMDKISGITGAAPIWHDFFESFLNEYPIQDFAIPEDIITELVCQKVSSFGECVSYVDEVFIKGVDTLGVSVVESTSSAGVQSAVSLLNPRFGAEFELSDELNDEYIVFEAAASTDIQKVDWYLNGALLGSSTKPELDFIWKPVLGEFVLEVRAVSSTGVPFFETVSFAVVE